MQSIYFSPSETAKLVRNQLKKIFPTAKFRVTSKSYSGGGSIQVSWQDGPSRTLVDSVVSCYAGGRFDGSIDMKISVRHWLLPDGSVKIASNPGTEGSMGVISSEYTKIPNPDCKLVSFGADFIHIDRSMSHSFAEKLLARLIRKGLPEDTLEIKTYDDDQAYIVASNKSNDGFFWERRAKIEGDRFMVVKL